MHLVLLNTLLIFFALCGVVCVQPIHPILGESEDIFETHLIIVIKLGVPTFPIVVIFSVVVCLS